MKYALFALLLSSQAAAMEIKVTIPRSRGGNPNMGNPLGRGPSGVPQGTLTNIPGGSGVFGKTGVPAVTNRAVVNGQVNPTVNGAAVVAAQVGIQQDASRLQIQNDGNTRNAAFTPAPDVRGMIETQDQFKPELDATPTNTQLDEIGKELKQSKQAESKGSEGAVSASLDKVFDSAARSGGITLPGSGASVAGKATELKTKIKQLVSVANTAAPRDAPGLYQQAIETAENGMSPAAAAQVKETVLASASEKARLSLGDLANNAYQAASQGSQKELDKELKGLEKWSELLGAPGRPLVNNIQRLVGDIQRVANTGGEAPRIHFRPGKSGGYDAVLPLSSVAPVPDKLITAPSDTEASELELSSPDAVVETALSELKRGGGAGSLYKAQRRLGASVPMAAVGSARYWLLTLYNRLVDAVLALFGRGPLALARGGAVVTSGEVTPAQLESFSLYGKLADAEASLSWRLSKPGLSWAEGRALLLEAKEAAQLHLTITGDKNGLRAVESLLTRLDRRRELPETDALALARWLSRLRDDALRATVKASPQLGSNKKIGGSWSAAAGRSGSAENAAASLLEALPSLSKASLVLDGPRMWISMPGVKIFVDARGTEAGGRLALAAETAQADKLEADWLAAGLSTDRRGKLVLGWIDGETAAAGASELISSLIAAMKGSSTESAVEDGVTPALAERLQNPEAAKTAAILMAHDSSPLSYAVIGEVNSQPALQSRRGKLTITVLRDPRTGHPSRAVAEFAGKPVSSLALGGLLRPQ